MKKYITAALSALTLAGCSQGLKTAEENPMLGNWVCITNYYGLNTRTEDIIQIDKDGFYSSMGTILMPIAEKPTLVYQQESFGKWTYKDKTLTLDPANSDTKQAHSKETMAKLKKDKKLRTLESEIFSVFNQHVEPLTFKILKQEKEDYILQEQQFTKRSYYPICIRAETFQKKLQSGEFKVNPNY